MDSLDPLEEERQIKEALALKELLTALGGQGLSPMCLSLKERNFASKGADVEPSGKQWKIVNSLAHSIKYVPPVTKRRSIGETTLFSSASSGLDDLAILHSSGLSDFDLLARKRALINSGPIIRRDKLTKTVHRHHLFLFSDVLLITQIRDNKETYDLQQIVWVKDMKLKYVYGNTARFSGGSNTNNSNSSSSKISNSGDSDGSDDLAYSFLILSEERVRARPVLDFLEAPLHPRVARPAMELLFSCEGEANYRSWIVDLENVLLAYNLSAANSMSRGPLELGWFHDILLGSFHAAACTGDLECLRFHIFDKMRNKETIDCIDGAGMTALQWAALRGQEACVRLLLSHGANPNLKQPGGNTSLHLAVTRGHETIARLLLDEGKVDVTAKNLQDRDALFMAAVYGSMCKDLKWIIKLLVLKGLKPNQVDRLGNSLLQVCAERSLFTSISLLVDAGGDVNVCHPVSQLSPLQVACKRSPPDLETIRALLDKGAYVNWKDLQGMTAFDIIIQSQHHRRLVADEGGPNASGGGGVSSANSSSISGVRSKSKDGDAAIGINRDTEVGTKWRQITEDTMEKVNAWCQFVFPFICELVDKGARFEAKVLDSLRPSFRSAVQGKRALWEARAEPAYFREFVLKREISGEELKLHKAEWIKDAASKDCQLCGDEFGLTNRRHHCRSCGTLVCDTCSSKKLPLFVENSTTSSNEGRMDRVCDSCFNRLCFEAKQLPSDAPILKTLKKSAFDLIESIAEFIEALENPDGQAFTAVASLRENLTLPPSLEPFIRASSNSSSIVPRNNNSYVNNSYNSLSPGGESLGSSATISPWKLKQNQLEVSTETISRRLEKLATCKDFISKFNESGEDYQKYSLRIIEKKLAYGRLKNIKL